MTISRANTLDEIVKRLQIMLRQHPDIAWARFQTDGSEEKSAIVQLIVMPSEPWWSGLERENLASEVENLLVRMVILEDERAIHPRRIDELRQEWKLLVDRDVARRLDTEMDRTRTWLPILEAQQLSYSARVSWGLADHLQSPAMRLDSEECFQRIVELADENELFGLDWFNEDTLGRVSNASQEAGLKVLALCCDVRSLLGTEAPRSTTDALAFLVHNGFLDSDCAVRLADWLLYAIPREFFVKTDRKRIEHLLAIRSSDFKKFCDAVSRAATSQKETKNDSPPAELLLFDLQAALARLKELIEHTNDRLERELLSHIESDVMHRHILGKSIEDLKSETEGVFTQRPLVRLLVLQDIKFDPLFPSRIAKALYGDSSLVYNIGEVLDTDPHRRYDSVWGRSPTYQPIGIESLPEFLQANGRGVIFFQDADQADPRHLSSLATMADNYLRCPAGHRIFVGNASLIVCGRFPIGTPREIDFHGSCEDKLPFEFSLAVENDAALRSPEHLSSRIRARFFVNVESIWTRYLKLVESGSLDEPLVRRSPIAHVERKPPDKQSCHKVEDLFQLIQVTPEPNKFDFFVSYSWTRTESQAHELVALLKSRGYNVFLDKDKINRDASMEELVPELVYNVRSSRAVLLFPIQLKEPIEDLVDNEDIELRHGRAIRAPALGGGGTVLVEWSWQTLELLATGQYLVVEQERTYAVAHGKLDPDFITRTYRSIEELADVCESYLELRQQQTVEYNVE